VLVDASARELLSGAGLDMRFLGTREQGDPDAMRVYPATVDRNLCSHCLACVKLCPSISWDSSKGQVVVNEVSCKGCGICGAICPAGAISQRQFGTAVIFEILDHIWDGNGGEPAVNSCSTCPMAVSSLHDDFMKEIPSGTVRVLCSGRAETIHVLETARAGIGGMLLIDCFRDVKQKERFERGERRIEQGARLLKTLGGRQVRVEAAKIRGRNMDELPAALGRFRRDPP